VPDLASEFSEKALLRTFFIGIVLGLTAAAGALYAFPAVDQHREASIVRVAPNGGNMESFQINIPMDRIMVGSPEMAQAVPEGLEWPATDALAGVRTEVFKIRNANNVVIGVGVRTAFTRDGENFIDWALHLPARGSLFVGMEAAPREGGLRLGELRSGSREFARLSGSFAERWVADTSGEVDAPLGRIELQTTYIGQAERRDAEEAAE
jgi:hypothetical protein